LPLLFPILFLYCFDNARVSCYCSSHYPALEGARIFRMSYFQNRILIHCWWECKLVQPLWKKIWRLLKNLNIDLPYDPGIPLLGIYPKECDTGYSRGTCTPMFIEALFTIAK
jgi:hypothetical protein